MGKSSNRDFIIPIKGLSIGKHDYCFSIDNTFFDTFEDPLIQNANLEVKLVLERASTWMKLESEIKGDVGVECDRCLEELLLPIDTKASLLIKFVKSEQEEEEDDEIITLDPSESELDLKQFFYDYICLALPLQRIHKKGECNPEMIARLESSSVEKKNGEADSPFGKLKNLLN
jgi:uncharacterized metal-binding protein YceD (DUF177 family)